MRVKLVSEIAVMAVVLAIVGTLGNPRLAEGAKFEPQELKGVVLDETDVAPYRIEAQVPHRWPGPQLDKPGVQQSLAGDKPGVRVTVYHFEDPQAAMEGLDYYAHSMAAGFREGGLEGKTVGNNCWVHESTWAAALVFQRGRFCALVSAPMAAPSERSIITEIAQKLDEKMLNYLGQDAKFEPEELRGVLLEDSDVSPFKVAKQVQFRWPGPQLQRLGVEQRLSVEGGPELGVDVYRFDDEQAAREGADFYAHSMAEVFREGGLEGQTVGESCWVSTSGYGAALVFQRGPFCAVVGAITDIASEQSIITEIAQKLDEKIVRYLAQPTWTWNNHALVLIPEEARAAIASHSRYSQFGTFDFPNEEEQVAHAPQEPPNAATLEYCVDWITRTVRPTWVPPDLSSHLIPVKAWANGRDAFVVRYVLNEHAVQIIHTRSETTVVVAPLGDALRKPAEAHAELMRETIVEVLSVAPPARVNSSPVGNVTLGLCQLNRGDMDRGPILGVPAATDGRFVAMRAIKCFGPATPRPPIIDAPLFDAPPAPAGKEVPPPPGDEPIEFHGGEPTPEELENEAN